LSGQSKEGDPQAAPKAAVPPLKEEIGRFIPCSAPAMAMPTMPSPPTPAAAMTPIDVLHGALVVI